MSVAEIHAYIESLESNSALYEEKNFNERVEALDFIEFHVTDHNSRFLLKAAEKVKADLEEIDNKLFQKLHSDIRIGAYGGKKFQDIVSEYCGPILYTKEHLQWAGYDNLDMFINRLLFTKNMPQQTRKLKPEMVYYQKTPARIIFELTEKLRVYPNDIFIDIGSGLGQACILVNLLSGIKTIGIEFEPAFCKYAEDCAASFNLTNIAFINIDARKADYSHGTAFFMYTPFWGRMLQKVLMLLKKRSLRGKIKIITYGPCTTEVAKQNWLIPEGPQVEDANKLTFFSSR